jgi:hypothetical protein
MEAIHGPVDQEMPMGNVPSRRFGDLAHADITREVNKGYEDE